MSEIFHIPRVFTRQSTDRESSDHGRMRDWIEYASPNPEVTTTVYAYKIRKRHRKRHLVTTRASAKLLLRPRRRAGTDRRLRPVGTGRSLEENSSASFTRRSNQSSPSRPVEADRKLDELVEAYLVRSIGALASRLQRPRTRCAAPRPRVFASIE